MKMFPGIGVGDALVRLERMKEEYKMTKQQQQHFDQHHQQQQQQQQQLDDKTVLKLSNMVLASDLATDSSYNDLIRDVTDEVRKYGRVSSVVVPRHGRGCGNIYVDFATAAELAVAKEALERRTFEGVRVVGVGLTRKDGEAEWFV
jgi:hypothetical protein